MARKRVGKDLRTTDVESIEYWEEVLRRNGLTMDAGRDRRLLGVGSTNDLADIYEMTQDQKGSDEFERV